MTFQGGTGVSLGTSSITASQNSLVGSAVTGLQTGQAVIYDIGTQGNTTIGGLVNGQTYYVIANPKTPTQVQLASSLANAEAGIPHPVHLGGDGHAEPGRPGCGVSPPTCRRFRCRCLYCQRAGHHPARPDERLCPVHVRDRRYAPCQVYAQSDHDSDRHALRNCLLRQDADLQRHTHTGRLFRRDRLPQPEPEHVHAGGRQRRAWDWHGPDPGHRIEFGQPVGHRDGARDWNTLGLRHEDAIGPIGFGISNPPGAGEYYPAYPGQVGAFETQTDILSSPAAVGTTIAQVASTLETFDERDAVNLAFINGGTVVDGPST